MEIYIDIVFLVNFIMNSFILWAIGKLCRQKIRYSRLLAGGLIMALMYVSTIIMLPFSWGLSAAVSLVIISLGIAVAFRPQNVRIFLGQLFIGYLCSFTLGGLGIAVLYNAGLPEVSWRLLIICVIAAYIIIKSTLRILEGITLKKQMLCPVTIYVGENAMSLQVLVDTGHTLQDPLNNAPVIIAEFDSIKELLPDGVRLMFYKEQEIDLSVLLTASTGNSFYERIRMIPFVSLGRTNGMLIGFRPDKVALSTERRLWYRKDIIIGIYTRKLSGDGRYQGLISPELVA